MDAGLIATPPESARSPIRRRIRQRYGLNTTVARSARLLSARDRTGPAWGWSSRRQRAPMRVPHDGICDLSSATATRQSSTNQAMLLECLFPGQIAQYAQSDPAGNEI
jgi:hypothetical protein